MKKSLCLLLVLCLLLSTASLLASCGSLSYESMTVDRTSVTTEYTVGDAPDLAGIVVNVRYNDRSQNVTIGYSDVTLTVKDETGAEIALADLTKTVGEKTVTVSYADKAISGETRTTSFTVTVHESTKAAFASMDLSTKNAVLDYKTNEEVDFGEVFCTLHYKNADDVILRAADLTFAAAEEDGTAVAIADLTKTAGIKTVTVSANDALTESGIHTATFKVSVTVGLVSITLDENTVPTLYVGEDYDLSGLAFLISYTSPDLNQTVGYADVTITVDGKPIDEVNLTETLGTKTLTVSIIDGKSSFTGTVVLSVVNPGFNGITLNTDTVTKEYYVTDEADFTGITVAADYDDDLLDASYAYGDSAITVTGFDSASVGTKTVTVTFADEWGNTASKTFTVTVKAPTLTSAVLSGVEASVPKGETLTLTGITLTLTYSPAVYSTVLTAKDLTVGTVDTSAAGTKNIEVSYSDPYTKTTKTVYLAVVVTDGKILELSASKSMTAAKANRANAGTAAQGNAGFEDQFFADGDTKYYAGDDNAFVYAPSYKLVNDDLDEITVPYLQTVVTAKIGTESLTKSGNDYFLGENKIFSYNLQKSAFTFAEAALDQDIEITIDVSRQHYEVDAAVKPTTISVHVIDAYNVYSAKDLCVIDNSQEAWTTFKETNGYAGVSVKGIVLQNDISLGEKDIPENFFYTSTAAVTYYYNDSLGEQQVYKTLPAGSKFLKDSSEIYKRLMANGESFRFEGNYFTLSTESFPLVAADGDESAFTEGSDAVYGADGSNASLFRIKPYDEANIIKANFDFNNVTFIGNANRNENVNAAGSLVSKGGLILHKSTSVTANIENVIARCFFVAFIPEDDGNSEAVLKAGTDYSTINLNRVKCFDSYQNAGFIWGSATINVTDSYIQRAGGPLFILQHVEPNALNNDSQQFRIPKFTSTNSVLESYVTGQEVWFSSVGAGPLAGNIMLMSDLLSGYQVGSYVSGNKMNLVALTMSNGNDAGAMANTNTQAYISIENGGETAVFSRMTNDYLGGTVHAWQDGLGQQSGQTVPVFSAASDENTSYDLIWTDGTYLFSELGVTTMSSIPTNFTTADYIGLSYGGFGIIVEFTPASAS